MDKEGLATWHAFAGFQEADTFERVLDFLKLEDIARLMMCNRSLMEMGKVSKKWGLAVRHLSAMNSFNICNSCEGFLDSFSSACDEGAACKCTREEHDANHNDDSDLVAEMDPRVERVKGRLTVKVNVSKRDRAKAVPLDLSEGHSQASKKQTAGSAEGDSAAASTEREASPQSSPVEESAGKENVYTFVLTNSLRPSAFMKYSNKHLKEEIKIAANTTWNEFLSAANISQYFHLAEAKLQAEIPPNMRSAWVFTVESITYSTIGAYGEQDAVCKTADEWGRLMAMMEEESKSSKNTDFVSKPPHVQFGLLYAFQSKCVGNLLDYYDKIDLNVSRSESCQWHFSHTRLPPGPRKDSREAIERVHDGCLTRMRMLERLVDLDQASRDVTPTGFVKSPYWFREGFLGMGEDMNFIASSYDESRAYSMELMYDMSQRSGLRFCSDENFLEVSGRV